MEHQKISTDNENILTSSSFVEEEEENMRFDDSQVVSVFRLKLLEAQFQESLYEVTKENSNFEGQIAQDLSANKDFVSEMDNTIDEVKKWRSEYAKSIQQEYAEMEDTIERDTILLKDQEDSFPETVGLEEELSHSAYEKSQEFDASQHESLQLLLNDLQREKEKSNEGSASDNQDKYHNASVELNRIEYEARAESMMQMELLKRKFLLSEKEIDNGMNDLNHVLAANSFALDEILSKMG